MGNKYLQFYSENICLSKPVIYMYLVIQWSTQQTASDWGMVRGEYQCFWTESVELRHVISNNVVC